MLLVLYSHQIAHQLAPPRPQARQQQAASCARLHNGGSASEKYGPGTTKNAEPTTYKIEDLAGPPGSSGATADLAEAFTEAAAIATRYDDIVNGGLSARRPRPRDGAAGSGVRYLPSLGGDGRLASPGLAQSCGGALRRRGHEDAVPARTGATEFREDEMEGVVETMVEDKNVGNAGGGGRGGAHGPNFSCGAEQSGYGGRRGQEQHHTSQQRFGHAQMHQHQQSQHLAMQQFYAPQNMG